MRKVLIVYTSREGQTAKIAQRMRDAASSIEGISANVTRVDSVTESDVAVADVFIVAGSVHFGKHERKLVRFVREHLSAMAARSSAFVSVSGAMAAFDGQPEAQQNAEKFLEATGWIPDRVALFAGAVTYTRYNFLLRWVMRRIASGHGLDTDTSRDFEYTDWDAVDRVTREFLTQPKTAAA